MQTIPVKYTDRIHGFHGRFLEVVSKAELKVMDLPSRKIKVCI